MVHYPLMVVIISFVLVIVFVGIPNKEEKK